MKRLLLILTLLMGYILPGQAQMMKFKLNGIEDTTVFLVRYEGSSMYYADTAQIKNGAFSFDGSKQEPGMYTFSIKGARYFDFIFNNEEVHIEAGTSNLSETMNIKKSEENKVFYDYQDFFSEKRKQANILNEQLKGLAEDNEAGKKAIADQQAAITKEVVDYQKSIVENHQDLLVSKIIKMAMDIEIPEAPKDEEGNPIDPTFTYYYELNHFFDNVDFTDDRLARVPLIQSKIEYFFSKKHMVQNPDTIVKYMAPYINQVDPSSTMYKLLVFRTTLHFQRSKVMGMDKGYHHMILNYWCPKNEKGEHLAYWYPADKMEEACENAAKKAVTDLGSVAPNIILRDTTDVTWKALHDVNAEYTILYFWDPECGHCKKETPKLAKLYNEKMQARNVEVFAVGKATGDDFEKWKAFIEKHDMNFINVGMSQNLYDSVTANPYAFIPRYTTVESLNYQDTYDIYSTPQVFVLDKDKKIVAKQLSIAQLEMFLDQNQGKADAEKLFDVEEEKKRIEEQQKKAEEAQH
ncbi:redoxin domain-containing protein [Lishizhenia tianjinensis]|nr:redoxin domain-containing protein [Lishizhenia tianjinensis]